MAVRSEHIMTRRIAPMLVGALVMLACGCEQQYASEEPPDDEALRLEKERAGSNARSPAEVAWDFYPKEIDNYFEKMDGIAAHPDHPLDPLKVPVSQRLDLDPPEFGPVEDPVKTPSEILGRNSWMIWCAGNEGFWDWLANYGGLTDLLKLIDSRGRPTRLQDAGLINEPYMVTSSAPDRFGLWLDSPARELQRDFRERYLQSAFDPNREAPTAYGDGEPKGYAVEAYKENIPPPEIYGVSSGVIGLRLFPNPNFINDPKAQRNWDADRYYNDESYYSDPKLIRPYRVGMACAFCHASYHPLKPPRDINNPRWENISGNIGAQYLRIRGVFGNLVKEDNFLYHLLDSQPAGTIDTSLIPSDNINNTNAMNSIFNVPQRVLVSLQNPREVLADSSLTQPSLWGNPKEMLPEDYASDYYHPPMIRRSGEEFLYKLEDDKVPAHLWKFFEALELLDEIKTSNDNPRRIPRILLDGPDSIGTWGALARVYLNIGTYWEQWKQLHTPLVGITPQSPFLIADAVKHSAYWHAIQLRVGPMRDYFLRITPPMPLVATPDGTERIVNTKTEKDQAKEKKREYRPPSAEERAQHIDVSKLERGRKVFANNCIVCHSSIQPETFHIGDDKKANKREEERFLAFFFGDKAEFGNKAAEYQARAKKYQTRFGELAKERYDVLLEYADPKSNEFWYHNPGQWLSNSKYIEWAEEVVEEEGFWRLNYLSIDYRIPINLVRTNSARAMATNAMAGNMWSDFASKSYQSMPSVGAIDFFNPYLGEHGGMDQYTPRHKAPKDVPAGGGGPGFYRVPTLVSIWTTAPLLHNNSLGMYIEDERAAERVTVDGRLAMFDDAIRKFLWPERRLEHSSYNEATPARLAADHGLIWRTPRETYLELSGKQLPAILGRNSVVMYLRGRTLEWFPWLEKVRPLWLPSAVLLLVAYIALRFGRGKWLRRLVGYGPLLLAVFVGLLLYLFNGELGNLRIGPIPKGTPVNLLANVNPDADPADLRRAITTTVHTLAEIESKHLNDEDAAAKMREEIAPVLLKVSKCPDFVMDQGHVYEWFKDMTDEDKNALIELLKTF